MTLRELAEKFSRDYDFKLYKEDGIDFGKYERNEIVKLDYAVGKLEVLAWAANVELNQTINVKVKVCKDCYANRLIHTDKEEQ